MKNYAKIILFAALTLTLSLGAAACGKPQQPSMELPTFPDQKDYTMNVAAGKDKITIKVEGNTDEMYGKTAQVIAMKAFEYYAADEFKGVSESVSEGTVVGNYTVGTPETLEFNRFTEEKYDMLYDKYYLVAEGKILKGPVYATEIEAEVASEPEYIKNIASKKGGHGVDAAQVAAVGGYHAVIDFEISSLISPNEHFDEAGNAIPYDDLNGSDAYIPFESMGKTYYFRRALVEQYDAIAAQAKESGIDMIATVYARPYNIADDTFPVKMTYMPWAIEDTSVLSLNTSNPYGMGYWVAMMEFFSQRYSGAEGSKGYVSTYIIGNEVDYATGYFRIAETTPDLSVFMEEYSRLMRLSDLAVKQANADISVATSFTHNWNKPNAVPPNSKVLPYAPRKMIDWLNNKTKLEGDYDWGISTHPYCFTLSTTRAFEYDTKEGRNRKGMTADFETSSTITYANLELLQEYLDRDSMKYDGKIREVHLSEQGFSSTGYYGDSAKYKDDKGNVDTVETNEKIQAGLIAASWYKASQLDCIKTYDYFPITGTGGLETENTFDFGLCYGDGTQKHAYEVWKNIDTQYSFNYAAPYLSYIRYYDADGNLVTYGEGEGHFDSYLDLLDIYGTGYDFSNFDYEKACPINTGEYILEFEDKIDMSAVAVKGESRLYREGTEEEILTVTAENVPEGVEVKYFDGETEVTDPTFSGRGSKDFTVKFYKDGELVATRTATLSNHRMATDKTVYKLGEPILVTVDRSAYGDETWDGDAWVGLVREYADITKTPSTMWFYCNKINDSFIHTYNLQEQATVNSPLVAGEYTLYFFDNYSGGPDHILCKQHVSVLPETSAYDCGYDLSGVVFADTEFIGDGNAATLKVTGVVPEGIEVRYEGNVQTDLGEYQAVAIFSKDGKELERRYAVLIIVPKDRKMLSMDKAEYYFGEIPLVTAYAPSSSAPNTWWVGLYSGTKEKEDEFAGDYLAFYYVKQGDGSHFSGQTVDLNTALNPGSVHITAGKYTVALFSTAQYDAVDSVFHFTVLDSAPSVTFTAGTDGVITQADDIIVTANIEGNFPEAWVGLKMLDSKNDYTFPGQDNNCSTSDIYGSVMYYYISKEDHEIGESYILQEQWVANNLTASGKDELGTSFEGGKWTLYAGRYQLILYSQYDQKGGIYAVAKSQIFDVLPSTASTLELAEKDKTTFQKGETVKILYNSAYYAAYRQVWTGFYFADHIKDGAIVAEHLTEYKEFQYVPAASGEIELDTSKLSAGTYCIILTWDGHYGLDPSVRPIQITVTE